VRFSIIVPIFEPKISDLVKLLDTISNQNYDLGSFELILVKDYYEDALPSHIFTFIPRGLNVTVLESDKHLGISGSSNLGAESAKGEYLIFVDQDDLLHLNAMKLLSIFLDAQTTPPVFIHSQYSNISKTGEVLSTVRCPAWSPIRLFGLMYAAHLKVIRKENFIDVGGFNSEYDGAQDYDLLLRLSEIGQISKIDEVLYFWRESQTSAQSNPEAKPLIPARSQKLVQAHLDRNSIGAKSYLLMEHPTLLGLRFHPKPDTKISIVIPTDFTKLTNGKIALGELLKSIDSKLLTQIELIIVTKTKHREQTATLGLSDALNIKWVFHEMEEFNFSTAVNLGFDFATNEIFLTVNDDIQFLNDAWLDQLGGYLSIPRVGVVGAKMYYPDGRIQHVGIGIDSNGHCFHPMARKNDAIGHLGEGWVDHEVDAVTGAFFATTREHWEAMSGFSSEFPNNYNDVAFCLKTWASGKSVLIANSIKLIHYESLSREPQRTDSELTAFKIFLDSLNIKSLTYTLTKESVITPVKNYSRFKKIFQSMRYRGARGFVKHAVRKMRNNID
jgi:GT2 family glycosyltransferase